ncbi:glycosyltransferase family 39 protein [Candidatus Daviesbacteria bacterium]|nr:glycosyltransferase family 39 protein [Candidatus Daviesbacteria bacterium]
MKEIFVFLKHHNLSWLVLLLSIIIFHWLLNLYWLKLNNAPIPWDPAAHSLITLNIADSIKSLNFLGIINSSNYYPILVHFLAAIFIIPFQLLTNNGLFLVRLLQLFGSVSLIFTIISVFLYTKEFTKNKNLAIFSTIIFSLFPIIYADSKWLYLDIPLVGMLMICLYFLEKSDFLIKKKTSILFFIFAGFVLMTKWTGVVYLIIPLVAAFIKILKKNEFKKSLAILIPGLFIFSLIILPWYLTNFSSLLSQTRINIIGEEGAKPADVLSWESITLYLKLFVNYQVTPLIGLVFIISSVYLLKIKNKFVTFPLIMIIFAYVSFTLIGNKDPRYTMPTLPFVGLIIGLFFHELKDKLFQTILILILIFYCLILTLRPSFLENYRVSLYIPIVGWYANVIDIEDAVMKRPESNFWSMDQIIYDLQLINDTPLNKVLISAEYEHLNPSNLRTYTKAQGLVKLKILTPDIYFLEGLYHQNRFPDQQNLINYLMSVDYAIVPVQEVGTEFLRNKPALEQIRKFFEVYSHPKCSNFFSHVAVAGTVCYIEDGEVVTTNSDVQLTDGTVLKNGAILGGVKEIICSFGCSFKEISNLKPLLNFQIKLIKTYTLPNNEQVNLFKIN